MGNQLFSSAQDWQNNACVNVCLSPIRIYIIGYKQAADHLAQLVTQTARDQDTLVYPIAFLYRQYIELQLKELIKESKALLNEESSFPKHHKINALWNLTQQDMRKIIADVDRSVGEYITSADFKLIDALVADFVAIDPESMTFRYPNDKSNLNNLGGLRHINIRHLAEQIQALSDSLDKFDLVVGVLRERQAEMQQIESQFGP